MKKTLFGIFGQSRYISGNLDMKESVKLKFGILFFSILGTEVKQEIFSIFIPYIKHNIYLMYRSSSSRFQHHHHLFYICTYKKIQTRKDNKSNQANHVNVLSLSNVYPMVFIKKGRRQKARKNV